MEIRRLFVTAGLSALLMGGMLPGSAEFAAGATGPTPNNGVLSGDKTDTDVPRPDKVAALAALAAAHAQVLGVTPLATAGSKTLTVTAQVQATSYYCVPASSRLVLSAFVSSLPSQATLASKLGTTTSGTYMSHVPGVVNSYETRNYYIFSSTSDLATFADRIQVDIQNYSAPLEAQVQMSLLPWYAGTLSGNHAIAAYGYYNATKVSDAYVYDPWTDSRAGRRTIYTSDLYDAGAPFTHNLVW